MNSTVTTLFTSSAPFIPPSFISPNYTNNRLRSKKFIVKSSATRNESRNFFRVQINYFPFRNLESSSINIIGRNSSSTSLYNNDESLLNSITKHIVYALFYIALGIFPIVGFRVPEAIAVPPVETKLFGMTQKGDKRKMGEKDVKGHEYSHCTKRLLESVSQLLRAMEAVKSGKVSTYIVEDRLDDVRQRREKLQEEIMSGLYAKMKVWKEERGMLVQRTELKAKREEESLLRKAHGNDGAVRGETEKFHEEINRNEKEYDRAWKRIYQIDDEIAKREAVALSIGVRELLSIEQECVALAGDFLERIRRQRNQR